MANSALDNFYVTTYGPTGLNILDHYYAASESSGNIIDQIAALNGTVGAGMTYAQPSILPTTDGKTCMQSSTAGGSAISLSTNLGGYPKTYELWFRPTSVSSANINIMFQNGGVSDGVFLCSLNSLTWIGLFNNAGGAVSHCTLALVVGTSYHIVCTSDGTAAGTKIYVNGAAQTMTAGSAASAATTASATLLGSVVSANGGAGYGEKFAVYSAILTPTQVTNNFNAGNVGPPVTNLTLGGAAGGFNLTGGGASLAINDIIPGSAGGFALTGGSAAMQINTNLLGGAGAFALSGGAAGFGFSGTPGSVVSTGSQEAGNGTVAGILPGNGVVIMGPISTPFRPSFREVVNVQGSAPFRLDYQFTSDGGTTWYQGPQVASTTTSADGTTTTNKAHVKLAVGFQWRIAVWNPGPGALDITFEKRFIRKGVTGN